MIAKKRNLSFLFFLKGDERQDRRHVREIQSLRPSTSLTTALGLLLESGASSLPVMDEVIMIIITVIVIIIILIFIIIINNYNQTNDNNNNSTNTYTCRINEPGHRRGKPNVLILGLFFS